MRSFKNALCFTVSLGAALSSTNAFSAPTNFFTRVATYPVYQSLPEGVSKQTNTLAEIIAASDDEKTLAFTDGAREEIVFLNAENPSGLKVQARVAVGGEPTSVVMASEVALAGVNTSPSFIAPSGYVAVINQEKYQITAKCDVKGQPDSLAISKDGRFLTVAVENERDEDLNDGVLPQAPAGHLAIFKLDKSGVPQNCDNATIVDMQGLATIGGSDPEPEFVSINDSNEVVVTLQENNHIAIVDLETSKITEHFSAGTVSLKSIPVKKARMSDASGNLEDVRREPDAVAWLDENRFVTANEGDYEGGSRGFTIWNKQGKVLFDSKEQIEHLAMSIGHYPAKRAHKKGSEPEGVTTAKFGADTLIFVNSERGNFVAIYRDTGGKPEFLQVLPTHIGPEGLLALPKRGLFIVANEVDDIEEKVRSHLSVYKYGAKKRFYPQVVSQQDPETGAPIGWGAMSGLAADKQNPNQLYAVNDSFYDQARIYKMDVAQNPAQITSYVSLYDGQQKKYDLEGIAIRSMGGFWLVSEGHPKKGLKHLLIAADETGRVIEEIELPAKLVEQAKRFSLEGVTEAIVDGKINVVMAVQREWNDDPKGLSKVIFYNPETQSWSFAHYPLDTPKSKSGGWVGLSEVTTTEDNDLLFIERDNQGGQNAAIKQITKVSLDGVKPVKYGETYPILKKQQVRDLLPLLTLSNGWVPDKVEGLALQNNEIIVLTDNDGVDDANGETTLLKLQIR
ncbi:esterase-like activity of phytase family protein [Polycladidibacter stylochi]|uniref:esterase-like activity of phytase family protein n=1 Tax=Polycladidibacter stylochi TaxID=1807766 RepID=UPI00083154B7|nr:esterase-like activity of phytase family protein [Pseudovibrio stylochi]